MPIDARSVDPRDQEWEVDDPAYRVYFWAGPTSSQEWELTGGDVPDALAWAEQNAAGRTFVVYAVAPGPGSLGLIRLLGTDPNRTALRD